MRTLPLAPSPARETVTQFDLSLAPLAPGEYKVEVTATSASGHATEVINFRVTS